MLEKYILKGKKVKLVSDLNEWGKFMQSSKRIIKQDTIGGKWISTVFLGIDHNYYPYPDGEKCPILFETMIFSNETDYDDEYQERYTTYDQAIEGHKKACELLLNELN